MAKVEEEEALAVIFPYTPHYHHANSSSSSNNIEEIYAAYLPTYLSGQRRGKRLPAPVKSMVVLNA